MKSNTEPTSAWFAPMMAAPVPPRIVLSRREYQRRVNLRRATHRWALRKTQPLMEPTGAGR